MTLRVVSLGIALILSARCAAMPACPQSGAADQTTKTQEVVRLLQGAAIGDHDAQFQAGLRYESGCGVAQDYSQSI
jgi:TPR repeat protein